MSRTVLVTGASGAIGRAIGLAFAAEGCRVALGCHAHPKAAEALAEEIALAGGQALVCRADVTDSGQVAEMFSRVQAAFGPVEVLVNNAGIAQQKMFCDITDADWQRMLGVHAGGTFLCCRQALPAMVQAKRGCIVNVASMWGQVGASCEVHYSAAKAAVIGLTRALAKEVAPSGIRVNCVAPGAVEGGMMEGALPEDVQALCGEIPLGRLGLPAEVAAAVVYLASPGAEYVTGQVLAPNGGMVV